MTTVFAKDSTTPGISRRCPENTASHRCPRWRHVAEVQEHEHSSSLAMPSSQKSWRAPSCEMRRARLKQRGPSHPAGAERKHKPRHGVRFQSTSLSSLSSSQSCPSTSKACCMFFGPPVACSHRCQSGRGSQVFLVAHTRICDWDVLRWRQHGHGKTRNWRNYTSV